MTRYGGHVERTWTTRVVPYLLEGEGQGEGEVPGDIMRECAVLAHDTSPEPKFVFANRLAMSLFEAESLNEIIGMESRRTVDLDDAEEQEKRGNLITSANDSVRE